jgi:hypothetical protein
MVVGVRVGCVGRGDLCQWELLRSLRRLGVVGDALKESAGDCQYRSSWVWVLSRPSPLDRGGRGETAQCHDGKLSPTALSRRERVRAGLDCWAERG